MLFSLNCFIWPLLPLTAKMPAKIFGCRVLTRPSSISLKPVYSDISVTLMLFFFNNEAVPPVDNILYPSLFSPLANSTMPSLFETEINAVLDILPLNNFFFRFRLSHQPAQAFLMQLFCIGNAPFRQL